jgi:hypothetical protein
MPVAMNTVTEFPAAVIAAQSGGRAETITLRPDCTYWRRRGLRCDLSAAWAKRRRPWRVFNRVFVAHGRKAVLNRNVAPRQSGGSASASVAPSPSRCPRLSGAIQAAPRTTPDNWSAAELDPQVASPGPGRHRLSGRGRILAETLRQRGNHVVTNKQFGRWFLCLFPGRLVPSSA